MISLLGLLLSPKVKGIAAIGASALMCVMPDEVDHILEGLLGIFGISKITLGNGEEK